jgi:hypothetical protein
MEEYQEFEPKPLPRWVTIPLGIFLAPVTLICVIGSLSLLVAPNVPSTAITVSISSLFLAGSLWVFFLSLRLIFVNPKSKSKLISPNGLRAIALLFTAIPIISLVLGTFWEKPVVHCIMTIAYIGIVLRLWSMANERKYNA